MISIGSVGSPGDAASYYARDNYYTADQAEGASAWAGEGAAELGLSGQVDAEQFEKVLAGELPNGAVLDAKRGEHRPGWDITMSVPKSVSILALVGGDARLVVAVREAARLRSLGRSAISRRGGSGTVRDRCPRRLAGWWPLPSFTT